MGQLFDQEFTHRASHLQGQVQMQDKLLISMVKSTNHRSKVTDSGLNHQLNLQI